MKYLSTITLMLFTILGYSQDVQLLSNFNNKSFRFTNILEKDISNKWDYFSITEVGSEYDATDTLSFDSHHFANYNLKNNFALTVGLGAQNDNFLPQIGIGYSKETTNWSYALYPTLYYGIADEQAGVSLNSVIGYTPKINDKWGLYNLLILDFDHGFGDGSESQQYLNLGIEYNKKLHFGVNVDLEQSNDFTESDSQFGLFLGVNL